MLTFVEMRQKITEAKIGEVSIKLPSSADGREMKATFDNKGLSYEVVGSRSHKGMRTIRTRDLKDLGYRIPKSAKDIEDILKDLAAML